MCTGARGGLAGLGGGRCTGEKSGEGGEWVGRKLVGCRESEMKGARKGQDTNCERRGASLHHLPIEGNVAAVGHESHEDKDGSHEQWRC